MNATTWTRRGIVAALACAGMFGTAGAFAQSQRSYAVLSLMADKITVVTRQAPTGSHLDRNLRQELPMPDDTFDAAAVNAVNEAIKRIEPKATTALYSTRDPKLFALQEKLIDGDLPSDALAQSLKDLLAQSKATHLVLVTKHRADAAMHLADGSFGDGKLVGAGFYVDPTIELTNTKSGEHSTGLFAPYAYLKLTLIDAASLHAVRQRATTTSHVFAPGQSAKLPWALLSATQKVDALREVIEHAVDDAVPGLLATP
jgi:hypothetical protein